jgi:2-polyprenyl-3-methyl-5-hydroxy-6-metoxy-1,4-benzoquinol methylase
VDDIAPGVARTAQYFDAASTFWAEVYEEDGLSGAIYRRRMELVAGWLEELALPAQAEVLDVGCGAGLLCCHLASLGLKLTGSDASEEMLRRARRTAEQAGVQPTLLKADAHQLPLPDTSFDAVVALGLLPWVQDEVAVIAEMARVLRPGGLLILTADNRARLNWLVEPRQNPLLAPLKILTRGWRALRGHHPAQSVSWRLHQPWQIDARLREAGLAPSRRTTLGFGPFTLLDRSIVPDAWGLALHLRLQAAGRTRPSLRRSGWHYVVAARKPAAE